MVTFVVPAMKITPFSNCLYYTPIAHEKQWFARKNKYRKEVLE
jgi:hypothetical protein